ncbi:MAG: hypothetical protein HY647_02095, partial [Acidobacteria bacterium]|nr:hypothetical protein [Acidobacteriota bacterium]
MSTFRREPGDFPEFFQGKTISPRLIVAVVIVVVLLILLGGATGIVSAGQRGVLLRFGAVTGTIKEEGLYFKLPFA